MMIFIVATFLCVMQCTENIPEDTTNPSNAVDGADDGRLVDVDDQIQMDLYSFVKICHLTREEDNIKLARSVTILINRIIKNHNIFSSDIQMLQRDMISTWYCVWSHLECYPQLTSENVGGRRIITMAAVLHKMGLFDRVTKMMERHKIMKQDEIEKKNANQEDSIDKDKNEEIDDQNENDEEKKKIYDERKRIYDEFKKEIDKFLSYIEPPTDENESTPCGTPIDVDIMKKYINLFKNVFPHNINHQSSSSPFMPNDLIPDTSSL